MSDAWVGGNLIQAGIYNAAPETPGLWIDAPALPRAFVGRDALVAELVQRLTSDESVALSAEGLPGVGKTTLAVALAHHRDVLRHFKDGVLWAGLGPNADVVSIQATWADALKVDISSLQGEDVTQAIRNAIGQRAFLLVLDDVWEQSAAEALRCGGPRCCHLLTTRDKAIARAFAGPGHAVSVPTLEDDPAYQLLEKLAPEACAADPNAARALARAVGGLPLALELVGSYLATPERTLFSDLSQAALSEMSDPQRRLQLAQKRLGGPNVKVTLQQAIELSLEGLRESKVGREAERTFYALGAFAPKPETFDRAAALHVAQSDDRTLALLVARNLLEKTSGESLALHQTLADVALTRLDDAGRARHRDHYLALVNEDREDWRRIEQVYGQIKWAWKGVDGEEVLQWVWALRIYQGRRGLWRDYLEWAGRGLELARAEGRRSDEATLLSNIGYVYDSLGQRQQAMEYFERALPIREEVGDRAGLAATLNNIGLVYDNLGQRQQALEYYERALPIQEEVGDRAGLATTLHNIGLVYYNLGQRQQALEYFERALPIQEEVGDRAGLATTLNNIGLVYDSLGQWQQALDYLERALPIQEEVGDRAGLANTLHNIGYVYNSLGQRQQALDYYERALPITEEVGDREGESVTRYNMAMVYRAQMRLPEAVAELKRVVELDRIVQHPALDDDLKMLAQVEAELKAQEGGGS